MQKFFIPLLVVFLSSLSFAHDVHRFRAHGTRGIDLGFLIHPVHLKKLRERKMIEASAALDEIIVIGARSLDWVDILQKEVPPAQREQVWRRADRIGNEASPFKPMHYNEELILELYRPLMANAPDAITKTLKSKDPLPTQLPIGIDLQTYMTFARMMHNLYSRTSRWMVLSQYKSSLPQASRDFRGWFFLAVQKDAIIDLLVGWGSTTKAERTRFVEELAKACPLVYRRTVSSCVKEFSPWITDEGAEKPATAKLLDLIEKGRKIYDTKFVVQVPHAGVETRVLSNGFHEIVMPTYQIDTDTLTWIQDRLNEAFHFAGSIGITLKDHLRYVRGAMMVVWQAGALPNVNGIGGDTITMDSNIPRWLEVTQIVMRHELGHVLGFPDCYTEFWNEEKKAFTYYVLDPADRMCALSGGPMSRHREALLKGYF